MNTASVIHIDHLKKHFGAVHAVEEVSLDVQHAEVFGFLGPNGAGKTTTISMMLGLTYPTAGTITLFGQQVTPQHNTVLRRVGTLVGSPAFMLPFSARRNLRALAYLYPDLPTSRIDEVLAQVDLQAVSNRPVRTFSTGMKQRLGVALALLNKPDLLVLDEPTNGMDPAGMQEIRTLLHALSEQGTTIFLSSHLLHEMELVCDRVAVIQRGLIIAQGTVSELLKTDEVIRIRTSHAEQTVRVLATLTGATHIQHHDADVVVQGVSSEQVMSFLVTQGLTPKEVMVDRPDLESVFLELTHAGEKQPA